MSLRVSYFLLAPLWGHLNKNQIAENKDWDFTRSIITTQRQRGTIQLIVIHPRQEPAVNDAWYHQSFKISQIEKNLFEFKDYISKVLKFLNIHHK